MLILKKIKTCFVLSFIVFSINICFLTKSAFATPDVFSSLEIQNFALYELRYFSNEILQPKPTVESQIEIINAINFNIKKNMPLNFTLRIENFNQNNFPKNISNIEYFFVEKVEFSFLKKIDYKTSLVNVTITYNDFGKVAQSILYQKPINKNDKSAIELQKSVKTLFEQAKTFSASTNTNHKYVAFIYHSLLENFSKSNLTPQKYSEHLGLMLCVFKIENRIIIGFEKSNKKNIHFWNKVKLGDEWYNIDLSKSVASGSFEKNIKNPFFLSKDADLDCSFEKNRYPVSTSSSKKALKKIQ